MTRRACLVAALLTVGPLAADPPAPKPPADVLLPAGAIRRFGDVRFRHPGTLFGSALSPDGKLLATAASQSVILWDPATGVAVRRFDTGRDPHLGSQRIAFSPDGTRLAVAATGTEAFIWDVATGKEVTRIAPPDSDRFTGFAAFTADGTHLVLGRGDSADFYDAATGKKGQSIRTPVCLLSPIGPTLIGHGPSNGRLSLVDVSRPMSVIELAVEVHPGGAALSPDGRTLATFDVFGRLGLWSVPDGRELVKPVDVNGDARGPVLTFTPDGRSLFLATYGGLTSWDGATLAPAATITYPGDSSLARAHGGHVLPDGDTLLVCGSDGRIRRISRKTGKKFDDPGGYTNSVQAAATPDGRRVAVGDLTGRVDLWDAGTGRRISTVCEAGGPVTGLAISADGRTVAVGRRETGTVELHDAITGKETRRFDLGDTDRPRSARPIQFAPDGKVLFARDRRKPVVWDPAAEVIRFVGDTNEIGAITPDGKTVVVSQRGPSLRFVDLATGKERCQTDLPTDPRMRSLYDVTALSVSPDGRRLAVATGDGRLRFCDPATGAELAAITAVVPPRDSSADPRFLYSYGVECLTFSADGLWLVGGGPDQAVRVWEVSTRREVRRFDGHEGHATFVAFGPGGWTVLSGGYDGRVYQWDPRPPGGKAVRSAWDELLADDTAYRAVWTLIDDPTTAVATLRTNLRPAVVPKPEELARLIGALNADEFAAREAATRALTELGPLAVPALRTAAAGNLSAEARERVTKLVNRQTGELSPNQRRAVRAVQVLEKVGSPEARTLLAEWASGADGAVLTAEAKQAVARLVTAKKSADGRSR